MTEAEQILWRQLRGHRMQGRHFRRQQVIGGYIVDFYCDAARLVVEVDGPIHDRQSDRDAERDRALGAYGIRIVRFRDDEVTSDLAAVLARIGEILRAGLPHPPPLPGAGRGLAAHARHLSPPRAGEGRGVG